MAILMLCWCKLCLSAIFFWSKCFPSMHHTIALITQQKYMYVDSRIPNICIQRKIVVHELTIGYAQAFVKSKINVQICISRYFKRPLLCLMQQKLWNIHSLILSEVCPSIMWSLVSRWPKWPIRMNYEYGWKSIITFKFNEKFLLLNNLID